MVGIIIKETFTFVFLLNSYWLIIQISIQFKNIQISSMKYIQSLPKRNKIHNHVDCPESLFVWLQNHWTNSACLLLGLRLYFISSSTTCFCLLPISSSRAFKVCSNMLTVCLSDSMVSSRVCSTRTPPITFQHFLSPLSGSTLVKTRAFYLLSSSSSRYLLKISPYSAFSLL